MEIVNIARSLYESDYHLDRYMAFLMGHWP